jgi:hypothetical protein
MSVWSSKEKNFCEGYLYENEYANSITSLFIVFIGMYGLLMNNHPDNYLRHYFSLFVINGIGSIVFHWTLEVGWALIDSIPMLILAYGGLYFGFDIILQKEIYIKRKIDIHYPPPRT